MQFSFLAQIFILVAVICEMTKASCIEIHAAPQPIFTLPDTDLTVHFNLSATCAAEDLSAVIITLIRKYDGTPQDTLCLIFHTGVRTCRATGVCTCHSRDSGRSFTYSVEKRVRQSEVWVLIFERGGAVVSQTELDVRVERQVTGLSLTSSLSSTSWIEDISTSSTSNDETYNKAVGVTQDSDKKTKSDNLEATPSKSTTSDVGLPFLILGGVVGLVLVVFALLIGILFRKRSLVGRTQSPVSHQSRIDTDAVAAVMLRHLHGPGLLVPRPRAADDPVARHPAARHSRVGEDYDTSLHEEAKLRNEGAVRPHHAEEASHYHHSSQSLHSDSDHVYEEIPDVKICKVPPLPPSSSPSVSSEDDAVDSSLSPASTHKDLDQAWGPLSSLHPLPDDYLHPRPSSPSIASHP